MYNKKLISFYFYGKEIWGLDYGRVSLLDIVIQKTLCIDILTMHSISFEVWNSYLL